MKTQAEMGGRRPQAQGRLEPPEAGRDGKDLPLEPPEGAQPWDTLTSDVWSPGWGRMDVLSALMVWGPLLQLPQEAPTSHPLCCGHQSKASALGRVMLPGGWSPLWEVGMFVWQLEYCMLKP